MPPLAIGTEWSARRREYPRSIPDVLVRGKRGEEVGPR